jgi:hypothetical protein
MSNDNSTLLLYTSDSHLNGNESQLFENPSKRLAEISNLPLPERHKQVRILTKMRKELDNENQKLEKRVRLIKKEEQIVVDKVISGFTLEKKIDIAKKEDERIRVALQTFKRKQEEQKLLKQKRISKMKQHEETIKRKNSEYIIAAKKDNYLYATEVKREALQAKQLAKIPPVNFYATQKQPHDRFRLELQAYSKAVHEQTVGENLDLVAQREVFRIVSAKRLNGDLQSQQLKAYTKLINRREFHKQYFSGIISPNKNASKLY